MESYSYHSDVTGLWKVYEDGRREQMDVPAGSPSQAVYGVWATDQDIYADQARMFRTEIKRDSLCEVGEGAVLNEGNISSSGYFSTYIDGPIVPAPPSSYTHYIPPQVDKSADFMADWLAFQEAEAAEAASKGWPQSVKADIQDIFEQSAIAAMFESQDIPTFPGTWPPKVGLEFPR